MPRSGDTLYCQQNVNQCCTTVCVSLYNLYCLLYCFTEIQLKRVVNPCYNCNTMPYCSKCKIICYYKHQ